jgi:hypothetical protein
MVKQLRRLTVILFSLDGLFSNIKEKSQENENREADHDDPKARVALYKQLKIGRECETCMNNRGRDPNQKNPGSRQPASTPMECQTVQHAARRRVYSKTDFRSQGRRGIAPRAQIFSGLWKAFYICGNCLSLISVDIDNR